MEEGQIVCRGHCWHTVAVAAEGGSCRMKERAEKVGVGRIVFVGLESQVRKEVVGMIELVWLLSKRKGKDCQVSYLVEGRCDSQEVHWEVLYNQISLQRSYLFSLPYTDEGNILHALESRSLVVVESSCRQTLL